MPNINDLKQSKFLKKEDVTPPILVTIRGFDQMNVSGEGAPPEEKWVLHFNETEKPLVLNPTNGQLIARITGSEDFEGWIGKRIVLFNDPNVSYAGKLTGGVRARAPKQAAVAPKPVPVPDETAEDDVGF
jgi:hypothetical protein